MTHEPANTERTQALRRHLIDNEIECVQHNMVVRVDSINAEQNVAQCSVEQRVTGMLRRTYSVSELVWRAEQALAPLIGLGLVPLITVRHKSLMNISSVPQRGIGRSPMDWMPELWSWLGLSLSREGFASHVTANDPFGWREALVSSGTK